MMIHKNAGSEYERCTAADRIVGSRQHERQPWLSDEAHDRVMEKSAARKRSDHMERRRL